jgi:tetratricopeptide (TPR) repeat protein
MPGSMTVSSQFDRSIVANVAFWRHWTRNLEDTELIALDRDRQNLLRAAEFGLSTELAWQDTAELILQVYSLVERRRYWREWIPLFEQVISDCPDSKLALKGRLLRRLGELYSVNRQFDLALATHRAEEQIGLALQDRQRLAHAHLNFCSTFWRMRRHAEAERHGQTALAEFTELGVEEAKLAATTCMLGLAAQGRGDLQTAKIRLQRSIDHYDLTNRIVDQARTRMNLAIVLEAAGEADVALPLYQQARDLLEKSNSELDKTMVDLALGTLYFNQGDLAAAEAAYLQADSAYLRRSGNAYYQAMAANNLGNVYLARGQLNKAEQLLRKSTALWRKAEAHLNLANTLADLANTLVAQGDLPMADPLYRQALAIVDDYPDDAWATTLRKQLKNAIKELPVEQDG